MEKLPKVFKRKWLKALRSGEYDQGKGKLFCDGKYCCLGVADEICGYSPSTESGILPDHDKTPEILRKDSIVKSYLMSMNDGTRIGRSSPLYDEIEYGVKYSFDEIANWIEKNL